MSIEIHKSDVIRLILQFFKENGLFSAFQALQAESSITLNLIENKEAFFSDIRNGRWDQVLKSIAPLKLHSYKLMALYEQIVYELLELSEQEFVVFFMKNTITSELQMEFPEKCGFLEQMVRIGSFDYKTVYQASTKEKNRVKIAEMLQAEVLLAPSSRLLTLLGQSLKYQESQGELKPNLSLDVFLNKYKETEHFIAELPSTISKKLIFSGSSRIETLEFSPNGQSIIFGAADGIIEVWDAIEAKLRKDLTYQAEEAFMLHDAGITALAVSNDNELLASGDRNGCVKLWRLISGKCLRKFETGKMLSFLGFGKENSQLVTANIEVKVYGLKSLRVLKEFRGGLGIVNCVVIREERVACGGKDGFLRIFDWNSAECISTVKIGQKEGIDSEIFSILEMKEAGEFIVISRNSMVLMNWQGGKVKEFLLEGNKVEILGGCLSLKAKKGEKGWIYAVGGENVLHCVDYTHGNEESRLKFSEKNEVEIMGIRHHPQRNLVVMWSLNGVIMFLTP